MTNHSDKLKSLAQEAQARAADLRDWFDPGLKDIPVETLKQRYCDEHSRFVRVDGLDIHYRDLGSVASGADKPPLLLIHGLMSSLHCWDGWMPDLSRDRRVVALDIPPFAITGPHPKGLLDEAMYMQLMLGFVDAVGLERFIAVGNSLGGFLSWRLALEAPERVQALCLLDAAGGTERLPMALSAFKIPGVGKAYQSVTPKAAVLAGHAAMFGDPRRMDPTSLNRIYDMIMREGSRAAVQENLRFLRRPDPERLVEVACPVFLQWGEADTLLPLRDNLPGFSARVRDLRVRTYPGVGHMPMEEIPARSLADFQWFLGEIGA
ncbi:MAG: hypothetical protein CME00_11700 [Geminicoccus sp.]|nr:hypothetical protein [Geminicoccus sp.]HCH99207.1 hypothetical protein [Alphaproteobacteria bacterium]